MHIIKAEQPRDVSDIRNVNIAAFDSIVEANIVDVLR